MRGGTAPRPDQAHELPGGRTLAWCEYGRADGVPLLYFHGIPGSRIDGRLTDGVAAEAGVRMIAIDRPGFGRSTRPDGRRSYTGWPADVAHFADALELERFAVLGYSCGGPYALAAAEALGERISKVGLVSSVAPSEMPRYRAGTASTDHAMLLLSRPAPWLARGLLGMALRQARGNPEKFAGGVDRDFAAPADQAILDEGLRAVLPELFSEAGRNGPAGIVEDFAVWARPSGLSLRRITRPVLLFHGEDDRSIPIAHSRWLAAQIPGAELTAWPGAGHLHTGERWGEVFSRLTTDGGGSRP